jgi:hypothetical protein
MGRAHLFASLSPRAKLKFSSTSFVVSSGKNIDHHHSPVTTPLLGVVSATHFMPGS